MELSSDHSLSLKPNPDDDDDDNLSPQQLTPEATSKKRKVLQKTVVSVKIGSKKAETVGIGKMKNEGPPPDLWSWRKYGQKPIKGSPYPRGYYRCSTTKGCSAKKQVERCKTDGSMFIITYTSSHNHPGPNISTLNLNQNQEEIQPQPLDQDHDDHQDLVPNQGLEKQDQDHNDEKNSIIPSDEEEEVEEEEEEKKIRECLEEPISSCSHKLINLSTTNKAELENHDHFFDELEELPIPPPFSSFMRSTSYFFDEVIRIPAAPS